ncbi:MAG: response regulator [Candidatus Aminicenantes bacterium]|jgi:DNA-binding NarL/FixJ family response regulator
MKVLVVDDSALLRERLVSMISELPGITTIGQAQNPSQALDTVQKLNPEVVILDIRLSEGNGIEILQQIKKKTVAPVTIMFTNYPYPQYRKKCEETGADFFFDKSTEFHKITDVLKKISQELEEKENKDLKMNKKYKT